MFFGCQKLGPQTSIPVSKMTLIQHWEYKHFKMQSLQTILILIQSDS